jgi:hypothetical protein
MESEFVLEFVVHHIVCRNTAVRSSPLIVSIPGWPSLTLTTKSATIGKLTFERGRRATFTHSHLLNLKTSFVLVRGHGDGTVRASCELDFFAVASTSDDRIPLVYDVEIGMDRPGGDRFGILALAFQLMPLFEFQELLAIPRPTAAVRPTRPERTPDGKSPSKRIFVSKQDSPRSPAGRSAPYVPDLQLSPAVSTRPTIPSIHERHMRRNELWVGNHCSTHTDDSPTRPSSRGSSETGGARSSNT